MSQIILKKYLKDHGFIVNRQDIVAYKTALQQYIREIIIATQKNESEEHFKNILIRFLKNTFYPEDVYSINTDDRVDCAISKNGVLQVLIEMKRSSNAHEMITEADLNKKALWEMVLYYLEKTRKIDDNNNPKINPDSELKNLIITDGKKFFIFDSQKFEQVVCGELERFWGNFRTGQLLSVNNSIFYQKVEEFFNIPENLSKLSFVCFDITELTPLGIRASYSILSKQILLKDVTHKITAAPLNAAFYHELLYILGLKEVKEDGKKVIKINFDVSNTFAVQTYKRLKEYNEFLDEEEVIDKTFSAIIVWTNRLLFIKLFEGQLLAINGDKPEYHILDNEIIHDFDDLHTLFFYVLGAKNRVVDPADNRFKVVDRLKEIPYLNSSLFENYAVEKEIQIFNLRNNYVEIKAHSKTKKSGQLKLVEYIIDFLNSYSFSSIYVEESEVTEQKEIIDAAVLGLIFEKINGYKDGSYYTPSFITEYICKETIENAVLQKVNEIFGQDIKSYDDLKLFSSDPSKKRQINDVINSLKICDPAVGSGHFLVSALNRIIAIKSDLGVLFYFDGNRLMTEYDIKDVNDVLTIIDGNGEPFVYDRANAASLKVQKTIFCEKRLIIENCLFGVDINDKAVSICQLRLWIELLKNAYYENNVMETLPNIDINIKCGNSLLHKLPVEVGKRLSEKVEKNLSALIKDYKENVKAYKRESNKANKQRTKDAISRVKRVLHQTHFQTRMDFMGETPNYEEIDLMRNAFEWSIEFPEVLDDDGTFLGFDCVIGNPPYGVKFLEAEKNYLKKNYSSVPDFESAVFFLECSYDLLKTKGSVAFIIPNTFLANQFAKKFRQTLLEKWGLYGIYNLSQSNVFEAASVRNAIVLFYKDSFKYNLYASMETTGHGVKIVKSISTNKEFYSENIENWLNLLDISLEIKALTKKIQSASRPLSALCSISQGLIPYDKYRGHSEETIKNRIWNASYKKDDTYKKELQGKDVSRYSLVWNGQDWLSYGEWLAAPRRKEFFTEPRILIREITNPRILATYTEDEYYNTPSIINCIEFVDVSPYYVLALINSSLMSFYHIKTSAKAGKGLFPKILVSDVRKIPISIKSDYHDRIVTLAKQRLESGLREIDQEIDKLVYEIYGLSETEIALIKESMEL